MDERRNSLLTALCLGLVLVGSVGLGEPAQAAASEKPDKERKAPPPVSLDDLYTRLKEASDETQAKAIATLIERRLGRSGSATADLLSDRARQAMGSDLPLAVELMDRAVALEPNWAEGWSRRATLFWRLSDSSSAIADLQRALVLEPRHFEAWAALGKLYLAQDDKAHALDAFRRAETLYPQWDVLKKAIERLTPDVEGRDL